MIDLYVELKALLQALDTAGIPYALCGGLALMVYQRPRATVDIDLILPAEVTGKVEEGGPDVLMLDCLLTTHPIVAEAWRRRVRVPFGEGSDQSTP